MGLPFAGNYPGDRRFASTGWLCRCGSREQEEHIRGGEYPVYSDIRREYDCLEEDEELESFLTRVLDRRDQLDLLDREEEEQEEQRSTVLRGGRLLRLQCICQLPPASIVTPVEFTWIHFGIYPKENALHVCIVLNIYNNWKL